MPLAPHVPPSTQAQKVHMRCIGPRNGTLPTVLLEAGLPYSSSAWVGLFEVVQQRGLHRDRRWCAYDRPGYGYSDPSSSIESNRSNTTTTMHDIAIHLDATLGVAKVDGPIIFVGWSFGGLVGVHYAISRPDRLAGLVLVDSTDLDAFEASKPFPFEVLVGRVSFWISSWLVQPGLWRMLVSMGLPPLQAGMAPHGVSEEWKQRIEAEACFPHFCDAALGELNGLEISLVALNGRVAGMPSYPLGDLPVSIINAGERPSVELTTNHPNGIRMLSRESTTRYVSGVGHHFPLTHPSHVVDGVLDIATRIDGNVDDE